MNFIAYNFRKKSFLCKKNKNYQIDNINWNRFKNKLLLYSYHIDTEFNALAIENTQMLRVD